MVAYQESLILHGNAPSELSASMTAMETRKYAKQKPVSTKCRLQTAADHCFHHVHEDVKTIVPLFFNPENSDLRSVCDLQSAFCTVQNKNY